MCCLWSLATRTANCPGSERANLWCCYPQLRHCAKQLAHLLRPGFLRLYACFTTHLAGLVDTWIRSVLISLMKRSCVIYVYHFGVFIFIHICIYLHTHTYLRIHIYISFPVCPLRENSNLPILWRLHAMHFQIQSLIPFTVFLPWQGQSGKKPCASFRTIFSLVFFWLCVSQFAHAKYIETTDTRVPSTILLQGHGETICDIVWYM